MARKTTKFERETVYAEVWAEPVTTVAKRYGISDVGLRKICAKLDVQRAGWYLSGVYYHD